MCHLLAEAIQSQPSLLLHPSLLCFVLCPLKHAAPKIRLAGMLSSLQGTSHEESEICAEFKPLQIRVCYQMMPTRRGLVLLSDNASYGGLSGTLGPPKVRMCLMQSR